MRSAIKNIDNKTLLTALFLVAYIALLLKLIVFKYPPGMFFNVADYNFIPFKTILPYLEGYPMWIVARNNLLGNIALFVPLGFLVPLLHRRLIWKHIFAATFLMSLLFEILQVILRVGIFDVDDILLNMLGAGLGYALFLLCVSAVRHIQHE